MMTIDISQSPALSVVICAHNSRRDYLATTLEALASQSLPKSEWELILVDNASSEALESWDRISTFDLPLRVIREEKLGLVQARLTGIRNSKGKWIVFSDDDNVLDPQYLELAIKLAGSNPRLGCFGSGTIIGQFEVEPPADVEPYLPALALRQIKQPMLSSNYEWSRAPYGAGLVVRRDIAECYAAAVAVDEERLLLDRVGTGLLGCGDIDIAFTACDAGMTCGVFPELRLVHLIPNQRLDKKYLQRLLVGSGQSSIYLLASRNLATPYLRGMIARVFWLMVHLCGSTSHSRRKRYQTVGELKGLWLLWRRSRARCRPREYRSPM